MLRLFGLSLNKLFAKCLASLGRNSHRSYNLTQLLASTFSNMASSGTRLEAEVGFGTFHQECNQRSTNRFLLCTFLIPSISQDFGTIEWRCNQSIPNSLEAHPMRWICINQSHIDRWNNWNRWVYWYWLVWCRGAISIALHCKCTSRLSKTNGS